MRRINRVLRTASLLLVLGVGSAPTLTATVIEYEALNLADVVSGEDLWMYRYFVSGRDFDQDQGWSVVFDLALYLDLASASNSAGPDWDILTFQPDPALTSDGLFDALALVDAASLGQPFPVTFVWLGGPGTAPGDQAFDVHEFDSAGNFILLESGRTARLGAAVPEPSTWWLLGSGAALVIGARPRRRACSAGHNPRGTEA